LIFRGDLARKFCFQNSQTGNKLINQNLSTENKETEIRNIALTLNQAACEHKGMHTAPQLKRISAIGTNLNLLSNGRNLKNLVRNLPSIEKSLGEFDSCGILHI
jgi:hypothetical protein